MSISVVVRGGGDLASGVAYRAFVAGWRVFVVELPQPLAVRRKVSFGQAVYDDSIIVEGIRAVRVLDSQAAIDATENGVIPVLVDPLLTSLHTLSPEVLVDARMLKQRAETSLDLARLVIGLGPGFRAGENCHAVVETKRGPNLGRVYWQGQAEDDTGIPETVGSQRDTRVIRAPVSGIVAISAKIGDLVTEGETIGQIGEQLITAAFTGVLRGAIHNGLWVEKGTKVGDLDPRQSIDLCFRLSDKALAIGGGVLEAVLSRPDLREGMWN